MMANTDARSGLSGLREWSEPVIHDRLMEAYRHKLGDDRAAVTLARQHAGVWRALIGNNLAQFESMRSDLTKSMAAHGLNLDDLSDADAGIMLELLEIVLARYKRSARTAKGYHLALIQLASRLRPRLNAA
jgi:hypothetical protein